MNPHLLTCHTSRTSCAKSSVDMYWERSIFFWTVPRSMGVDTTCTNKRQTVKFYASLDGNRWNRTHLWIVNEPKLGVVHGLQEPLSKRVGPQVLQQHTATFHRAKFRRAHRLQLLLKLLDPAKQRSRTHIKEACETEPSLQGSLPLFKDVGQRLSSFEIEGVRRVKDKRVFLRRRTRTLSSCVEVAR